MEENRFIMDMLVKLWSHLPSGMSYTSAISFQRDGIQRSMFRWECISNKLYKYSLMYEASGVGDMLFEDFRLRLDGDPRAVTFLILYALFFLRIK